jgi:Meiotically up-regulated gene 113
MISLYIIGHDEDGPLKIGVGADPEKRCRGLQTGTPVRLRVMRSWPHEEARRIERILKSKLAEHRMVGGSEWFDLSLKQLLMHVEVYFPSPAPQPIALDELDTFPYPEVECYPFEGRSLRFFCDHCQEWYRHGAGPNPLTSPHLGHRAQHCRGIGGPFPHGYKLVGGKPATPEMERACLAGRPPAAMSAVLHGMGITTRNDKGVPIRVRGGSGGREHVDGAKGIKLNVRQKG